MERDWTNRLTKIYSYRKRKRRKREEEEETEMNRLQLIGQAELFVLWITCR